MMDSRRPVMGTTGLERSLREFERRANAAEMIARGQRLPHFHGTLAGNGNTAITAGFFISYPTVVENDLGTWNSGTGRWTVPIAGVYRVTFGYKVNGTAANPTHQIRQGASTVRFYQFNTASPAFGGGNCSWEGRFAAGDDIGLYLVANNYTTQDDGAGQDNNFMTISFVRA